MVTRVQDFGHRRLHRTRGEYLGIQIPRAISKEWSDVVIVDLVRTLTHDGDDIITLTAVHGDPEQPHEPKPEAATFTEKKKQSQVDGWFGRMGLK